MAAYYNEIDPFAAEWIRALISKGLIPDGEVDTRSIVDVRPDDLRDFTQCHFFAGIAGWGYALRLAGWPDERPIWTGSCPCQPFSVAGKGRGTADERHLWPVFFNLIRECRPAVVMGEQVAGKAGYGWLDGVAADLEAEDYACRAVDIPACAVDAPHIRSRLYWCASDMADANRARRLDDKQAQNGRQAAATHKSSRGDVGDADRDGPKGHRRSVEQHDAERRQEPNGCFAEAGLAYRNKDVDNAASARRRDAGCQPVGPTRNEARRARSERRGCDDNSGGERREGSFWSDYEWRTGTDGKARRVGRAEPGICGVADGLSADLDGTGAGTIPLLAQGVKGRVGKLKGYGNAIVPQLAAEVIRAFMDVEGVDGGII